MQVDIETAKTRLLELVEATLAGEEVIIASGDGSSVKVVKFVPSSPKKFRLGGLEGLIPPPPDSFFDPLSEEELRDWESPMGRRLLRDTQDLVWAHNDRYNFSMRATLIQVLALV